MMPAARQPVECGDVLVRAGDPGPQEPRPRDEAPGGSHSGKMRLDGVMEIRHAKTDELEEVGKIRVTAYRADGFLSPESGYEPTLRGLGGDGSGNVLVAVAGDGKLVGTVMLQTWPDAAGQLVTRPGEAEIRALAVLPEARGTGLGRALVASVMEQAEREQVRRLLLFTEPEMVVAHRLYEQAGFARLPERDWSPLPGVRLLAYGLMLDPASR
jgi:ribosomal protein S18 acetylase RimI-like enzyme